MGEKRATQIEDKKIVLADGKEYVIKPLLFSQAKKAMPIIKSFTESPDTASMLSPELLDKTMEVAHMILKRTYPDISRGKLEDLIDLQTVRKIFAIGFGSVIV